MVLTKNQIIEQQWKVQTDDLDKILDKDVIIFRKLNLSIREYKLLLERSTDDVGKIYDIPQLIGKTLTWLTGIKLFVRFLGGLSKEEEICVTRISHWFKEIEDFGVKNHSEITTKIIYDYLINSKDWAVIYKND
jgi:hypothetical protein